MTSTRPHFLLPAGSDSPNTMSVVTSAEALPAASPDASTADERLKEFEYKIAVINCLRDGEYYFDPGISSRYKAFFRGQISSQPKKMLPSLLYALKYFRSSLSGDVLSEAASAIA